MRHAAIRVQEMNPAKLAMLYRKQFELCRVKKGETIACVSDLGTRREFVEAAFAAGEDLGADIYEMCVNSIPGWTRVGVPTIGQCKGTLEALKQVDMIVIFHVPLFSRWLKDVMDAGVRVLMIIDAPDDLEQLLAPKGIKEAVQYAEKRYAATREVRVLSDAGTDLTYRCGEYPTMMQWGYADEKGHFDHWGGGHVHTFPNEGTAHGTVVFQPGDIVILPYCRYVADPVRLEIRDGHVVKIEGGLDAKLMRDWLDDNKTGARRPRSLRRLASRLGHEPAGALVRYRPQRRRARARPRRRPHLPGQFPVLDRAQHPGRRQAPHPRPLRRADARLHRHPRQRSHHRKGPARRSQDDRGAGGAGIANALTH